MMRNLLGKIYCQRCRAANSVAEESCAECGTRLMLVIEPTTHRFEDAAQVSGTFDEHLLERISLLENNLARVVDKLERTLDLMLKQAQTTHTGHNLLDALISTLAETGALNRELFRLRRNEGGEATGATVSGRFCEQFMTAHTGAEAEGFRRAVAEGCELIEAGRPVEAARALERAASTDAENGALNQFVGRALLAAGRPARALTYLKRAAKAGPEDPQLAVLLGLALAETGEAERATEFLAAATRRGASSFILHLGLGQLAAGRGDWRGAVAQYKLALARRASPEVLYLLGRAHQQLAQPRAAIECLRRAVALKADYAEAWGLLGRLLAGRGDEAGARTALTNARRARREGSGAARRKGVKAKKAAPRGGGRGKSAGAKADARRLLSGGDPVLLQSLAEALLAEVLPR
jgi:tetratricopeptide (TPR) repeat protein